MILLNKLNTLEKQPSEHIDKFKEMILNFIVPVIMVVASVGFFVLIVMPLHRSLPELESQIDAKNQEVSILKAKVDQLKHLEANRDLVLADLTKMSWALEERDKVPELTEQVRLMSLDSGVSFTSLEYENSNISDQIPVVPSPSLEPDPALYKDEKINVGVDSNNLSLLVNFLKISENSIRLFKVESFAISANESNMQMRLVMSSPYLNPVFSIYSETSASIDLNDTTYRNFMQRLDSFNNYAQKIDATLPKI